MGVSSARLPCCIYVLGASVFVWNNILPFAPHCSKAFNVMCTYSGSIEDQHHGHRCSP